MRVLFLSLTSLFILSFSVTGFSQRVIRGDGSEFTESRTVPAFDKIGLAVSAEVILVKGNSPGVRIEGEKNVVDALITEVGDNELKIHFALLKEVRLTKPLRVWVTTSNLVGVWNSGSGRIHSGDIFKSETMTFHCSGSGQVELGLEAGMLDISVSGSGGVRLNGKVQQMDCSISGSGHVRAEDLTIRDKSNVHISGSGSCDITTDGTIEGGISGSGSLNYRGNPSSVDVRHSGSGRARKVA